MLSINFVFGSKEEAERVRGELLKKFKKSDSVYATDIQVQTEKPLFGKRAPVYPKRWYFDLVLDDVDMGDRCYRAMTKFSPKRKI